MQSVFNRPSMSIKALTSFSNLTPPMRSHLTKVYSNMLYCCIAASVGGYLSVIGRLQVLGWLGGLLSMCCFFYLLFTRNPHNLRKGGYRFEALLGFGFLTGFGTGPILRIALAVNPAIIPAACLAGTVIFLCFSLAALTAQRRSMLYLGGYLSTGLLLLLGLGFLNIFFRSPLVFNFQIYLCLMVFIAFIPFDTQMILERFEMGDQDHIMHSLDLFIDLVQVIRMLIVILTKKEEKK
ncbi:Bax inhibitor 1-like [Oopsacas minuta]|uniref:Bax inhibitor 1-like n=1 Tax=Oopsacas minuta TaxID=111878 RepID=A0AAV7K1V5_9METZ|nr:Bax inhibitor 1-like [Oopsacas minuta]